MAVNRPQLMSHGKFPAGQANAIADAIEAATGSGTVIGSTSIAAAGTSQGAATALTSGFNVVTTATYDSADGVVLPTTGLLAEVGSRIFVYNNSASKDPIRIWPGSGRNFAGRSSNLSLWLAPGKGVEILVASSTLLLAFGDQVSGPMEHWVHLKTTLTNVSAFQSLFNIAISEQEGTAVEGTFRAAYVGKSTAAMIVEGRFNAAAYRDSGGGATKARRIGYFQDGSGADATTLIDGSNETLLALAAEDGTITSGVFYADSSVAVAANAPAVNAVISSNNLQIQAKGVATDTVAIWASLRITEFQGQ